MVAVNTTLPGTAQSRAVARDARSLYNCIPHMREPGVASCFLVLLSTTIMRSSLFQSFGEPRHRGLYGGISITFVRNIPSSSPPFRCRIRNFCSRFLDRYACESTDYTSFKQYCTRYNYLSRNSAKGSSATSVIKLVLYSTYHIVRSWPTNFWGTNPKP